MTIPQKQRYLPHTLDTRFHACKLYRNPKFNVRDVCRRYKISKASLMRWNARFDGTRQSLMDHSHRPKTPHPNRHTELEIHWIRSYLRRLPHITLCELYGKLFLQKNYTRHIGSLYRFLRKNGYFTPPKKKRNRYTPQPYDTPKELGIKWQMDVKYVPKTCNVGPFQEERLYQYTMIDEASRERFLYAYKEQSAYSTVDFMQRAIRFFQYKPKEVQTDNGFEFTFLVKTDRIHPLDAFCAKNEIRHHCIRPRTPRHNGKVERSHRSDNERFYAHLRFYNFNDLQTQMRQYLRRSNNIPMRVLGYLTPKLQRKKLALLGD